MRRRLLACLLSARWQRLQASLEEVCYSRNPATLDYTGLLPLAGSLVGILEGGSALGVLAVLLKPRFEPTEHM